MNFDRVRIDRWDEAIPLGNGNMGGLLFGGDGQIKLSIDSSSLWDLRQDERTARADWNFSELLRLVEAGEEKNHELHHRFGDFYEGSPFPTKIPAGGFVFEPRGCDFTGFFFSMKEAFGGARLSDGGRIECFFSANNFLGYLKYPKNVALSFSAPDYFREDMGDAPIAKDSLLLLGYPKGQVSLGDDHIIFRQPTKDGEYAVILKYKETDFGFEAVFGVRAQNDPKTDREHLEMLGEALDRGYDIEFSRHKEWWAEYFAKSYVRLPEGQEKLSRLYELAHYLFASGSRAGFPPMPLQGVWTAAEGKLPPWKGDYHFDLNVQGTYNWAFRLNRLEEISPLIEYFKRNRKSIEEFSERFFGEKDVFFIPGTADLNGNMMGGWVQYSYSITSSFWMLILLDRWYDATGDEDYKKGFLIPVLKKSYNLLMKKFLVEKNQRYEFIISASPEINDNKYSAWVKNSTYDLSLTRAFLRMLIKRLSEVGEDTKEIRLVLSRLADESIGDEGYLFAQGMPVGESHRHFSQCMNIFPIIQLDHLDSEDRRIIEKTIGCIEKHGTVNWIGFSFVWMAALYAMAEKGGDALNQLNIFADAFVSENGFHLNGDQKKCGYSRFTYRPFTLEGNFMLAEAVDEMLMQYHHEKLRLFPAVPKEWQMGDGCEFHGFKIDSTLSVSASLNQGAVKCTIENLGADRRLAVVCFGKTQNVMLKSGRNELCF